jgi:hypothetical protein
MKNTRAVLFVLFATILASSAISMANAAIVPFDGIEYSWLHENSRGDPTGDWITQINDTVAVRPGDTMQFQNRWYNGYAGTTDIRISYGGGTKYTCIGADEYVLLGLNYGSYYPAGEDSVSFYAAVTNCSEERTYGIAVNHQYVYNGIMYGAGPFGGAMGFRRAVAENGTSGNSIDTGLQDDASATDTSAIAAQPSSTGVPTTAAEPTPGFGFGAVILVSGAFIIAYMCGRRLHK